jgi:ribonucleoside-diphosphate reductase alpha chain
MNMINSMGDELKAGGGRRVALMLSLDAEHQDLPEFLDAKLDLGRLNNANVSVVFNGDPAEWIEDPANKESWDKIVANSLKGGEPGLLNVGLANRMSNVSYWNKLVTSNPCGEIIMAPYECCCLGSLVLPRFVSDGAVDFGKLGKAVKTAVRFLDNVLSVNNYPLPIIEKTCNDVRRIGLGVMGLHDMLLLMGHKYSSPEGRNMVDMVMAFIKNEAYLASANLAEEKGAFPVYDSSQEAGFADTELGTHFAASVMAKGLRNCAVLTIPPTGTTSMVAGVTSGIEPMFAPAYERRYFAPDNSQQMEVVFHPLFEEFLSGSKDVEHFEGAHDITPEDHLKMQTVCQKHVDNAVSKTINIPPGFPEEEFSSLLKRYLPQLKGITVYPEGSRENQPLTPIGLDDAKAMRSDSVEATAIDTCKDGKCEI